jgi:hypothetical protein
MSNFAETRCAWNVGRTLKRGYPDMSHSASAKGFVHRHLDPASRLGEVLFGLIMVLTVTLTAELTVADGKEGIRQLLFSTLGCNIAWGIIDAIMFIMNAMTERSGRARLIRAVQAAPDDAAAMKAIDEHMGEELEDLSAAGDREEFSRAMLRHLRGQTATGVHATKADFKGALICFWLVFFSCLPAAVPFLIFSSPIRAIRVSNAILIALLFIVGYKWGGYVGSGRLKTGIAMVVVGLALVGVAILLGG